MFTQREFTSQSAANRQLTSSDSANILSFRVNATVHDHDTHTHTRVFFVLRKRLHGNNVVLADPDPDGTRRLVILPCGIVQEVERPCTEGQGHESFCVKIFLMGCVTSLKHRNEKNRYKWMNRQISLISLTNEWTLSPLFISVIYAHYVGGGMQNVWFIIKFSYIKKFVGCICENEIKMLVLFV